MHETSRYKNKKGLTNSNYQKLKTLKNKIMKVEINYVDFKDDVLILDAKEYPVGGLIVARRKTLSDLLFVNKEDNFVTIICPEYVLLRNTNQIPTQKEIEPVIESNKFDGDFILEFSRILLNRK